MVIGDHRDGCRHDRDICWCMWVYVGLGGVLVGVGGSLSR